LICDKAMTVRILSAVLLVVAACGPLGSGAPSRMAVNYQVLGEVTLGQAGPGPPISAATSISQLVSLMIVHQPGHPSPQGCCWAGAKVSEQSLLLAFGKPGRTQCFTDHLSRIYLAGPALVVEIQAQKAGCVLHVLPPDPVLLVAVPLSELPHQMIEVRLHRVGDVEERSHFQWDWTAVADLRQPVAETSLAVTDIQAAVDAAWDAPLAEKWQVSEVAVRRWSTGDRPCGLPTTSTAGAHDLLGVVVRVMYAPNDGRVPWVAKQHEFTWRVGQVSFLDDCGVVVSS
jgi:hypothetical protein